MQLPMVVAVLVPEPATKFVDKEFSLYHGLPTNLNPYFFQCGEEGHMSRDCPRGGGGGGGGGPRTCHKVY